MFYYYYERGACVSTTGISIDLPVKLFEMIGLIFYTFTSWIAINDGKFILQSDATTAFLRAARSGNLEKVIEYLDTDLDIDTANSVSYYTLQVNPFGHQVKF